jgi:asparagine synthase (glutamine-hydrolysing)
MCGIAGIFAYHYAAPPVERDELRAVRDHMAARGPDGEGEWFSDDGRVALGHRRLSIIDLSDRAAQPMVGAGGAAVISFNGEIYNYRELRDDLAAKGHQFRTDSDTEVLLHLYADKGEDMLQDLRGMFAFAIWDPRKDALLLARDPYGIKPLYYADDGWTLRFASQVKALLTSRRVSRLVEPAGVAGFYLFGSVPEPFTLYQEIRSVPAGSCQWVSATGPGPAARYFSPARAWRKVAAPQQTGPDTIRECVRDAVLDSVRHHLVSDVPVGAFLSAGIDSGTLVGLMKDAGQSDIHTVTLAFREFRGTSDDESPLAADVAAQYGVRHTIREVGEEEFREDLPRILAAMDQPTTDGVNAWFVSKAAHEAGLKVAVSGVGGDELFGGYGLFRQIPRSVRLLWLPSRVPGLGRLMEQVQAAFAPLFPRIHPKAAGLLRYGGTYPGAWLLRRGLFLPSELPRIIGGELAREGLRRLQPMRHLLDGLSAACEARLKPRPTAAEARLKPRPTAAEAWLKPRPTTAGRTAPLHDGRLSSFSTLAALDATFYLRNVLLRDVDWASMAHSLEVRTPLVDRTVLETLAPLLRAATGIDRKRLLAASPSKPLPPAVVRRAKTGFSTPVPAWQQRLPQFQAELQEHGGARDRNPWNRPWSRVVAASLCEYSPS